MAFKISKPKQDEIKEHTFEEILSTLPTYTKQDKVLIIDADIISFKVSSVCEYKYIFTSQDGEEFTVKSKKAFKEYCLENDLDYYSFSCENKQVAEPLSFAIKTLNDSLKRVLEFTNCNRYEMYIGGSNNFRLNIPLPLEYKSSRSDAVRPLLLTDLKEYLIRYKGAKKICGAEADDVVQHRMRTLSKQGIRCTLYTIDKDSKGVVDYDITIYNPDLNDIEVIKGGLGNLYETKNGIRGDGLKWLMFQTAMYDKIDNYVMNSHYIKRYGEKSFYMDFSGCISEKELLESIIVKWKELLPEKISYTSFDGSLQEHNWLSLAEMYYSCAKMQDGSFPTLTSLFDEYGVNYNYD